MPRDAEFARVRQYMIRRCRYAAALVMNVQVGWGRWARRAVQRCRGLRRCCALPMLCPLLVADPLCPPAPRPPHTTPLATLLLPCLPCPPVLQMPEHGRDPDDIMHILDNWSDLQLEDFFK